MSTIGDPKLNQFYTEHGSFLNGSAAAIARGVPVYIDSSGDVHASATAGLIYTMGVAAKAIGIGEAGLILLKGYCDYIVTDGNVAVTDLVLHAIDGGVCSGATEAEIEADPTLAYHVIGKNLAADTGTVGICWIDPGGC